MFVPVLELGVPGVAWATLIAEYSAALCGFFMLRKSLFKAIDRLRWPEILEVGALKEMASTNGNIFIRTICLVFSFAFFTAQSAAHGELILAVNTVLLHFQTVMAFGLDGFAHAVEAMGGSAYGARDKERFKRAAWVTTLWSGGMAAFVSIAYLLFGNIIVALFTDATEVIQTADQYLFWMVISPVVSCWSYQLDGLFVGTGHAREMRNAMIVSTAGVPDSHVCLSVHVRESWTLSRIDLFHDIENHDTVLLLSETGAFDTRPDLKFLNVAG